MDKINNLKSFIDWLRKPTKAIKSKGGYVFPNKEAADTLIKHVKTSNLND